MIGFYYDFPQGSKIENLLQKRKREEKRGENQEELKETNKKYKEIRRK